MWPGFLVPKDPARGVLSGRSRRFLPPIEVAVRSGRLRDPSRDGAEGPCKERKSVNLFAIISLKCEEKGRPANARPMIPNQTPQARILALEASTKASARASRGLLWAFPWAGWCPRWAR